MTQSTFWRAWNHRFSDELRDAVEECADSIIMAARACDISFPERVAIGEADEPQAADRPEHELIAEKTDEVWQQAKPFVCDAFALDRGPILADPRERLLGTARLHGDARRHHVRSEICRR